jgi:hypothetical protein
MTMMGRRGGGVATSVGFGDPDASKKGGLGLGTVIVSVVGDHVDNGPEAVEWKD